MDPIDEAEQKLYHYRMEMANKRVRETIRAGGTDPAAGKGKMQFGHPEYYKNLKPSQNQQGIKN